MEENTVEEIKQQQSNIAQESEKTKRARNKLQKQFEDFDKQVTPQALKKKTIEIHRWIARHAPHRVALKTKAISLFDENQNTAQVSAKVCDVLDQIQKSINQAYTRCVLNPLKGVDSKTED